MSFRYISSNGHINTSTHSPFSRKKQYLPIHSGHLPAHPLASFWPLLRCRSAVPLSSRPEEPLQRRSDHPNSSPQQHLLRSALLRSPQLFSWGRRRAREARGRAKNRWVLHFQSAKHPQFFGWGRWRFFDVPVEPNITVIRLTIRVLLLSYPYLLNWHQTLLVATLQDL